MAKKLVLKNRQGEVVRTFSWEKGDKVNLFFREDTRRFELWPDETEFEEKAIPFQKVSEINRQQIEESTFSIADLGHLEFVDNIQKPALNIVQDMEDDKSWWKLLSIMSVLVLSFMAYVLQQPLTTPTIEEELKQHVVKIIKRSPKKPNVVQNTSRISKSEKKPKKKIIKKSVKRLGALAVLGRLKKSSQRGGVNLGQIKTTRGPGLGGTAGSGGIQKTLYGKGIVAAPVGAGGNIKGAGGYGTKGKGGGKDGYGKLSLIGSSGTESISLGREAIVQGGLDKDLIADIIRRKMGQVRFCYEQGLQSDPKLTGRVAVNFTIGPNGRVKVANLANTTLNSALVESCILSRLKGWKFPLPEGGVEVKVSYPFLLRRAGRG